MKLTLNQMSALDELWTKTDLTDADDPALELDQDFEGNVIVDLCRTGGERNLHLGSIAPNGTITFPQPEPEPTTIKARDLRQGLAVRAEGAPAWSHIRKVHHSGGPGTGMAAKVTVDLDWGRIEFGADEDVETVTVDLTMLEESRERSKDERERISEGLERLFAEFDEEG